MKKNLALLLFTLIKITSIAQTHSYLMNGDFVESAGGGPLLNQIFSCGSTPGNFNSQTINTVGGTCGTEPLTVFSFADGSGLSYPNTGGFIDSTYTIHIFFKFDGYSQYQRIIDFKNSATDTGMYTYFSCLNLFPNGNVGTCPYFNSNTFYLLSLVRDGQTKEMEVYVNGTSFANYIDVLDYYVPTSTTTPITLFVDDSKGMTPCESQSGSIKYFSLKPSVSSSNEIADAWNNICSLVSLPLKLTSFTAKMQHEAAYLNWSSENEFNTSYFDIESSMDGILFLKVGKVAAYNTAGKHTYSFKDKLFNSGFNRFYRLKMVDVDGKSTYSSVKKVSRDTKSILTITPNPVTSVLNINLPLSNAPIEIKIYNSDGKLMLTKKIVVSAIDNMVSVRHLSSGIYLVKATNGIEQWQAKFLKQ